TAAFVLLAWSATTSVVAIGAKWLPLPPRKLLIGGLLGCALGQLAVWGLGPGSTVFRLLPGLFLAGAANGILNAALGRQAVASVPADRSAMGSGANNTARYLGSATGLTICAVVLAHSGSLAGPSGLWSGWNTVVLITVGFSLLGAFSIVAIRPTGDQPQSIG
ncbi:MAG: MFS transporter, partial [Verrucomicrobiae bacterium]|nr:MFS transporter [Verrucomicrobiae bacterium]